MIFPLNNEEKNCLQRLNQDKATILALRKLFLNVCTEKNEKEQIDILAAQRIALDYIDKTFYNLSLIEPDNQTSVTRGNLV